MKVLVTLYLTFSIVFFFNCGDKQEEAREIKSYKDVPQFIKNHLDSLWHMKLIVADPGEDWNSTCVQDGKEPFCQLITASISNRSFRMEFWAGGYSLSRSLLTLNFKGERILSQSLQRIE